jgi:hypothetical protein
MTKNLNINVLYIIIILIILYIILFYNEYYNKYYNEYFYIQGVNTTIPNTTIPIPIDRTRLYGSISLQPIYFQNSDDIVKTMNNPIDKTIINMSNPNINYEDKTLYLSRYSDILL